MKNYLTKGLCCLTTGIVVTYLALAPVIAEGVKQNKSYEQNVWVERTVSRLEKKINRLEAEAESLRGEARKKKLFEKADFVLEYLGDYNDKDYRYKYETKGFRIERETGVWYGELEIFIPTDKGEQCVFNGDVIDYIWAYNPGQWEDVLEEEYERALATKPLKEYEEKSKAKQFFLEYERILKRPEPTEEKFKERLKDLELKLNWLKKNFGLD